MKILYLKAKDCFCYKEIDIDFTKFKNNIILLGGEINKNDNASVGAGKTSLFEIINFILFNKTLKGEKVNRIIRNGKTKAFMELTFMINKDMVVVKKTRTLSGNVMKLYVNKKDVTDRTFTLTQNSLLSMLDTNFDVWKNSILLGQNELGFFYQDNNTKVSILGELFNFNKLNNALVKIKSKIKDYKDKLMDIQNDINKLEYHIEREKLSHNSNIKKQRETLWKLKKSKKKLFKQQKEVKVLNKILNVLYKKKWKLSLKKKQYDNKLTKVKCKMVDMKSVLSEYMKSFKGNVCPHCDTKLNKNIIQILTNKRRKIFYKSLTNKEKYLEDKIGSISSKIITLDKKYKTAQCKQHSSYDDISNKLSSVTNHICSIKNDIVGKKKQHRSLKKTSMNINKLYVLKNKNNIYINIYQNLEYIFGTKGIRFYKLKQFLPILENKINKYLFNITDGQFFIKNLSQMDKLIPDISYRNMSVTSDLCSGGQNKLLRTLMSVAFGEMVLEKQKMGSYGFLLFDEILAELDENYIMKVLNLLKELSSKRNILIFIVTNQKRVLELGKDCDRLIVNMKDGVSILKN